LIGDWLVKTVDGKPCNVVELQGTVGASVAIDRKKGFADAIAKASKHQNYPLSVRRLYPQ
jgi:simple sugar transport system substrate-binding protein